MENNLQDMLDNLNKGLLGATQLLKACTDKADQLKNEYMINPTPEKKAELEKLTTSGMHAAIEKAKKDLRKHSRTQFQ